jgi:aspartate aminotransferase-like enzyme
MLLFTPGPTPVLEDIRLAMSQPTIHHRTPEFEAIFKNTREKLIKMFQTKEVIMIASSGTGAMEASVINFCQNKALTINAGKFGERFGKICKAQDIPYTELKYEWHTPASVDEIMHVLKGDVDIDAIFIQVCESAGGLRHPVEAIAKAVKAFNKDIMIVADGITAVGVEPIDTSDIDVLISGSQKAFMLPPGLSMLGLNDGAIKRLESYDKGYYLNLKSELKKQQTNTTAYTAATTLIIGLGAMLDKIEVEGSEKLYHDTRTRAQATKKALEAIGLEIYPTTPAPAMTTISFEKSDELRKILKTKYAVNIAGGQDHLKGKIFRINHMGLIETYEAAWVVNAIELALSDMGIRAFDGKACAIFNSRYFGLDV